MARLVINKASSSRLTSYRTDNQNRKKAKGEMEVITKTAQGQVMYKETNHTNKDESRAIYQSNIRIFY